MSKALALLAGGSDVEVDLTGGHVLVALGLAELEVLEDGGLALGAVGCDVDLGRVGAEVDDTDLGALSARADSACRR